MRPGHAFVVALLAVVTLVAPATPAVAEVRCRADYLTYRWPGGFQVEMAVTNTGSEPANNWWVEFDLPAGATIVYGWEGTFAQNNGHVRVDAPPWHTFLLPDDVAIPQFYGTYPTTNAFILSNITLNGVACAVPV